MSLARGGSPSTGEGNARSNRARVTIFQLLTAFRRLRGPGGFGYLCVLNIHSSQFSFAPRDRNSVVTLHLAKYSDGASHPRAASR